MKEIDMATNYQNDKAYFFKSQKQWRDSFKNIK